MNQALAAAHAETEKSLAAATLSRDREQDKLRRETAEIVVPLRRIGEANHLAALAVAALALRRR